MSETEIQNSILEYLNLRGDCFAWRNNSVGIYDPGKGIYRKPGRFCIPGVADILGFMQGGVGLAIEVKGIGKEKNVSPAQKAFLNKVAKMGGIAIVASDIDTVRAALVLRGFKYV